MEFRQSLSTALVVRGSIARTRLRSFHKEADPGSAVSPGAPGSSLAGSLGYTNSQWFTMVFDDGRTLIARLWLIPLEARIMLSACNRRDFTRAALFSLPVAAQAFQAIDTQLGARHQRRTPTIHRGSAQRTISAGSLAVAGWDSSMCSTGGTLPPKPNS